MCFNSVFSIKFTPSPSHQSKYFNSTARLVHFFYEYFLIYSFDSDFPYTDGGKKLNQAKMKKPQFFSTPEIRRHDISKMPQNVSTKQNNRSNHFRPVSRKIDENFEGYFDLNKKKISSILVNKIQSSARGRLNFAFSNNR